MQHVMILTAYSLFYNFQYFKPIYDIMLLTFEMISSRGPKILPKIVVGIFNCIERDDEER